MKNERNILIAFALNLAFSIFEFLGGIYTGSVAIISDAIHDMGDAVSIGIAYGLEKISKRQPDSGHTYGYARYSVLGSVITTVILIMGSVAVTVNAVGRIIEPAEINYDGMIIFAVAGVCINLCAAFFTRGRESINQRSVNLHMIEDVMGWFVVLIGAVVMKFTDIAVIDPVMSIAVAVFIFVCAVKNLKEVVDIFLEKTPKGIDVKEIEEHIKEIDGVEGVHHIHVRSIDGMQNCATMHIVASCQPRDIKEEIRNELREHGIDHITLEFEEEDEKCGEANHLPETVRGLSHIHCHHH